METTEPYVKIVQSTKIKTLDVFSGVIIVSFEQTLQVVLVFPLMTLNK